MNWDLSLRRIDTVAPHVPRVFTDVRGKGYLQGLELTEAASAAIPKLRRILLEAGVFVEFMAGAGRRSGGLRYVMPTSGLLHH